MTDNLRNYHIIRQGLEQLYPTRLAASQLRMLRTLALIIHGLIASGHAQLPKLAEKAPGNWGGNLESRTKQLARFVANEHLTAQTYWLPFVQPLLLALTTNSERELVLCLDGSVMGRRCVSLVASIVYAGRSLPIAWLVVKGNKGHLPQARHLELVEQVHQLVGQAVKVMVLGAGEFDGVGLLARFEQYGWRYVSRTANTTLLYDGSLTLHFAGLGISEGGLVAVPKAYFTKERYGPVLALAVWEKGYKQPLYLVSNLCEPYQAVACYKRRFRIECFFSDSKTRGFRLDKSHLANPERVSRLLIGAVLAYWWLTYLGVEGRQRDWDKLVHRTSRTDLSFFQLGWRIKSEFLRCNYPVPFGLSLSPTALF